MPDNTSSIIPIGGGGGGAASSVPFSGITGSTNTTAAMVVGTGASLAFTGTSTLATASTVLTEFSGQTNISGPDNNTNVEIGSNTNDANAGTGGTSVVIGNSAANASNQTGIVVIGSTAALVTSGSDTVVIGRGATATASANSVVIGVTSTSSGTNAISIGVVASAAANSIALSGTSAANEFVIGGSNLTISNAYIGKGKTSTTAAAIAINATGGSGADNAGGGLNLAGGIATGTGAGGDVNTQTSARSTTSSTPQTLVTRQAVVAGTKTLTAGAATNVVRIGVPQGLTGPVGVTIFYAVRAADAADFQLRRGSVHIAAVNKAGTETAVISAASEAADGSVLAQSSASTLTYALTVASNAADTVDFMINAVSGLTETTLDVSYQVLRDHGAGTITPQ